MKIINASAITQLDRIIVLWDSLPVRNFILGRGEVGRNQFAPQPWTEAEGG
jgi:hypothetical protein